MTATICCLSKVEDGILLAGSAHGKPTILPRDNNGLRTFLMGDSPHILWQYTRLILEYKKHVEKQLEEPSAVSLTVSQVFLVPVSRMSRNRILRVNKIDLKTTSTTRNQKFDIPVVTQALLVFNGDLSIAPERAFRGKHGHGKVD
ncbi:MAG: hypothetical protein J3Q66DRAFT_406941 [Benniella sp.]|nr:MAG: hypothetical protein J3Q66DRAFT_406941 [Benniella sp.]